MSRSRAIGSRFAREVAEYLAGHGFPYAERRVDGGSRDRGDIAGVPGVVIECKATKTLALAEALGEAKKEAGNDKGCRWYVAVLKRRNHPVSEAYAVVPLWILAEMLADELPGWVPDEVVARHPSARSRQGSNDGYGFAAPKLAIVGEEPAELPRDAR